MKIYSQGDQAIVVAIEKEVSKSLTEDLLTLRSYLIEQNYPFIIEIVPSESDMMIVYDARDMIKHHNIQSPFLYMKALIESIHLNIKHDFNQQDLIEIPIVYGSKYGPDLESLLKHYKIKLETFIELHSKAQYFVSMMGYSPGFPYLTGLNKKLYINHTSKQKKFIPAGSVVLEGKKCGIVTTDTINDWLVIGYTPLSLFNPKEHDGVIPCGALDTLAHEIANRLVANDKNEATLEMTNKMATIRFTEPTLIALAGGNVKAYTEHMTISPYKLYLLDKGDVLKFRETSYTSRVYLAVGGGFELDAWLGSNSTDFNVKIGGFKGRTLQDGDEIKLKRDYKVTSKANRMGMMLEGEKIKAFYEDMPPYQTVKKGTIQIKRDGTPIILLNDHYTLGSYPQIGTIASYHLTKLAQKPQGSRLKFQFIDILTAEKNLVKYSNWLNQLFHGIEYRMQLEMMK